MKIAYINKNFRSGTLALIDTANGIIEDYQARDYQLTLRQLYYQMVSRDLVENSQAAYNRLGTVMSNGRKAGLVDWGAIEDRTRNLEARQDWRSPQQIVETAYLAYKIDHWDRQGFRPEVWVEKEALAGVVSKACQAIRR